MEKNSKTGRTLDIIIFVFALAMCIYHLYTAYRPLFSPIEHQTVHLGFGLILVFLVAIRKRLDSMVQVALIALLLVFSLITISYIMIEYPTLITQVGLIRPVDTLIGGLLLVIVFIGTGFAFGWALPLVTLVFTIYSVYGNIFYGFFHHKGYSWARFIATSTTEFSGIYGTILGVSADFIMIFMIFAGFLEVFGAGDFFIRLALAIGGKLRSGPAQAAVIGSGLLGSVNGIALANVATTGVITIPMMKKRGYSPEFAGAVETCASAGGILMPPIMGIVAFVMSGITGIPYLQIIKVAFIPAIIYYYTLSVSVHLRSCSRGIKPVDDISRESLLTVLKDGGHFFIPMIVLVYVLALGYSATRAGLFGIITLVIVSIIKGSFKNRKYIISKELYETFFEGLHRGARNAMNIAVAAACMGLAAHALVISGLAYKIIFLIKDLSGNQMLIALILMALISLLFGMGIPNVATYVLVALLAAPVVIELGVPVIAAHLFVLYFSVMANLTPPVGACALLAAQLAEGNYIKTAVTAVRLGLPGFFLPFLFIYNPGLLLQGTAFSVISEIITTVLGVTALAVFFENYFMGKLNYLERIVVLLSAITLIWPGNLTNAIGMILFIAITVYRRYQLKHNVVTA